MKNKQSCLFTHRPRSQGKYSVHEVYMWDLSEDEMTVDEMTVDEITVVRMTMDKMKVDKIANEMTKDNIFR